MARGHGDKLARKQQEAVSALLTEPTIGQAAAKVKVNERTLREWLKLPTFLSAYRDARRQVVEAAIGHLQQATGGAVVALWRNLTCGQASAEIKAAIAILDQSIRAVEVLDLAQEVANLKQEIERLKHGDGNPDARGGEAPDGPGWPGDGNAPTGPPAGGPGTNSDGSGPDPGQLADPPASLLFPQDPFARLPAGG